MFSPNPEKQKFPELFPFFVPNSYICTSSKSRAKQRKETRTATKSLPVTGLPALYVLSINRLKKTRCFSIKDSSIQRTYFPYKACVDLYISDFSYIKDDTLCYFNTFDNCLYQVLEDTIVPRYYFDRGPYTTWTTIEEYEKNGRYREFGSIKFDETDRYIIGSYIFKNKSYNFIYNKATDQTYNFTGRINDDILEVNSSKYFSRWNIDDHNLSISIPPQLFVETIDAKKESLEAGQWEIYKQQHRSLIDAYETIDDDSSDPVIISYRLK